MVRNILKKYLRSRTILIIQYCVGREESHPRNIYAISVDKHNVPTCPLLASNTDVTIKFTFDCAQFKICISNKTIFR